MAGREGGGGERVFSSWFRDLFARVLVAVDYCSSKE